MSDIIDKIVEKLPNTDYLKPRDLVQAGIFVSVQSVRNSLKKNLFPNIKISPNRVLIPRDRVVKFLESNSHGV